VQHVGVTAIEIGQFQLIQDAEDAIIGRVQIGDGEVPVECGLQFVFVNLLGDRGNLFLADVAA
jgi:hypothetical protein